MTLVVIMLPIIILFAFFAINIAYVELVRTELQVTTDAACRAASRTYVTTGSKTDAVATAQAVAARNPVAGKVIPLQEADLDFGRSVRAGSGQPYVFTNTGSGNAVRVVTRTLSEGSSNVNIAPLVPMPGINFSITPEKLAVATQVDLDVGLVIDRSGSMAYGINESISKAPLPPDSAPADWTFGDPTPPGARWLDAHRAVQTFLAEMAASPQRELVSLSTYNHETATNIRLTDNYASIPAALDVYSAAFHQGATNIGDGIQEGAAAVTDPNLNRFGTSRALIVMTDGIHNTGTDPRWAARRAHNHGITIFTVTFSNEADQNLMRRVAKIGGGLHFHADSATQLSAAFREIARRLPTLITQ